MATVTGFTAARMAEIEAQCVVNGAVDLSGNLLLERQDGTQFNAGSVVGPPGDPTIFYAQTEAYTDAKIASEIPIEKRVNTVPDSQYTSESTPDAYPVGITIFQVSSNVGTSWPLSLAMVETVKNANVRGYQKMTAKNHSLGETWIGPTWMRSMITATTWTNWAYVSPGGTPNITTQNLNNLMLSGCYFQNANANTSVALNYPVLAAGMLRVSADPTATFVYQEYFPYKAFDTEVFWRSFQNTAWGPWRSTPKTLPGRVVSTGPSSNPVTATSWGNLASGLVSFTADAPMEVTINYGGWITKSVTTSDIRCSVNVTGATDVAETFPSWGSVIWSGSGGPTAFQGAVSKTMTLNAGAHTIRLRAYIINGGTGGGGWGYPYLEVVPVRYL